MIDEETDIAIAAGQTKTFRLQDYGGFFRSQEQIKLMGPRDGDGYYCNSVEMTAQQWRTTVRALLRIDVYGHEKDGFKYKGLKDLITELVSLILGLIRSIPQDFTSSLLLKHV